MRVKAIREKFRQNNNQREPHKAGGKIPHSIFRNIKHGGVSEMRGAFPSNVTLSAIAPIGGKIRRYRGGKTAGYGFWDDVGSWFKGLFSRSNTNQIASNLLKKAVPFVTNLAGDIFADQALHANPLDTIKKHTFKTVKNLFNQPQKDESVGGVVRRTTNNRAKAAYKKYVKKTKGGAILTD